MKPAALMTASHSFNTPLKSTDTQVYANDRKNKTTENGFNLSVEPKTPADYKSKQ